MTEALQLIQRAVALQPANPFFLDSLGWAYFKTGKLNEAERYLSDSVRLDGSSAIRQEHLGDTYMRLGKSELVRAAWNKA
jgi:predicted Zn-dependent protease